jgi:hypothetical protein
MCWGNSELNGNNGRKRERTLVRGKWSTSLMKTKEGIRNKKIYWLPIAKVHCEKAINMKWKEALFRNQRKRVLLEIIYQAGNNGSEKLMKPRLQEVYQCYAIKNSHQTKQESVTIMIMQVKVH